MDKICLKEECQLICDLIDLLSLIYEDLRCDLKQIYPAPHLIEELKEFFKIVQCSKSLVLTDPDGNIITDKTITATTPVHGYGLLTSVGCRETVVSHKTIYAEGATILPIPRLLDPKQRLSDAYIVQFIEAICCLRGFYRTLAHLCPKLLVCCDCHKCSSHHESKKQCCCY